MGIIVMVEYELLEAPDFDGSTPAHTFGQVHAAPSDLHAPEDPADKTLCGKDTADMEKRDYQPARPGAPWYPPNLREWVCEVCDGALQAL